MTSETIIPGHVAITMDGNRRWAKEHGLSVVEGHLAGAKRIEPIVEEVAKKGISYLSLYAFSTENWGRPDEEISGLMQVFRYMLQGPEVEHMREQGVRIKMIGDYGRFPSDIKENIQNLEAESEVNNRITVNFALGYGGQDEILRAVNKLVESGVTEITRELLESKLDTAGQPPVDLMIRTGGVQRTSGFLMWESAYSELYFTPTLWPDFSTEDFQGALSWYSPQNRRFGK